MVNNTAQSAGHHQGKEMNKNYEQRSANWHGRVHRNINQAFGPYHSANFRLPGEKPRRQHPVLDAIALVAFAAIWFALFWILGVE